MTRVLLAEDDASISEPLARALRREGYEVEVREDGPGALAAGMQGGPGLAGRPYGTRCLGRGSGRPPRATSPAAGSRTGRARNTQVR
ncbi:hypothetical protein SGRIM128S_05909 [Streptomyces griseomycini]